MFLLCKNGDDHHEWYVLSSARDGSLLEIEARRLNSEDYEHKKALWLISDKTGGQPIPLDETKHRKYFVLEVADWPEIEDAGPTATIGLLRESGSTRGGAEIDKQKWKTEIQAMIVRLINLKTDAVNTDVAVIARHTEICIDELAWLESLLEDKTQPVAPGGYCSICNWHPKTGKPHECNRLKPELKEVL